MTQGGPTLDRSGLRELEEALVALDAGFDELPACAKPGDTDAIGRILLDVAERMRENYPYHHPLYAGQMLKPPHPVARLAYALSLWINPNNHALDGGRASSAMEKEAVADIARMFGWDTFLGHLCGGGTMANLEALWVARERTEGRTVVASRQAHYTHSRLSGVLGVPFEAVDVDARGRMDVAALDQVLRNGDVGTVVATMGATASGACDPLPAIIALRAKYGFRLHVDAAYGGYYVLVDDLADDARAAFDRIREADSIVVDPHKHGLQPYGCGCVLFRDPSVGAVYKHESPYTYFTSSELHLGEISLECSRAGASAVALWATHRLRPPIRGGRFAADLAACRRAALALYDRLRADRRWMTAFEPELDIVLWAPRARSASEVSARSREVFEQAAVLGLHLAVATMPAAMMRDWFSIEWDTETVACLRSCLMKPEHEGWIDEILQRLAAASTAV